MLRLDEIRKEYVTGDLHCRALDGVSLEFRKNEFVAILGPSGSGKTTLLNVIGGLDRYDSGDIKIDAVSTKEYKDRDWDTYRNHRVGFVFQSYNLIPHQSVIANVELALTIGGLPRAGRREKALAALERVGLGEQADKKPSQLSGGQMQRVAIARALVNDPEIVLADEPTGALDSKTGVQVMELLREVAQDRLVIMVTHNEELADAYATRIVSLRDGKIVSDTNPYEPGAGQPEKAGKSEKAEEAGQPEKAETPEQAETPGKAERADKAATAAAAEKAGKSEKPGRHSSMSFATCLGLSLDNLKTKRARTLLTAFAGSIGIIGIAMILAISNGVSGYIEDIQRRTMAAYPITIDEETVDLTSMFAAGAADTDAEPDHALDAVYSDGSIMKMQSDVMASVSTNDLTAFKAWLDSDDCPVRACVGDDGIVYSYDTKFGVYTHDPEGMFVDTDGSTLTETDVLSSALDDIRSMMAATMYSAETGHESFEELLPGREAGTLSSLVTDSYEVVYGSWPTAADEAVLIVDRSNEITSNLLYELGILPTSEYRALRAAMSSGETVEDLQTALDYEQICSLTYAVIPDSDLYIADENGKFSSVDGDVQAMESLMEDALQLHIVGIIRPKAETEMPFLTGNIGYTSLLTEYLVARAQESAVVQAQEADPETDVLTGKAFSFGSSYEKNLETFGVTDLDSPSEVRIYTDSFEQKEGVSAAIEDYNAAADEEQQITYTDIIGLMISSVTTIIDVISWVLIAFVAVSLVVSSIMIGIITYISVLERTREIGILRALGASKRNISRVFNAETFLIGLISGLMGVGVTLLLLIPVNLLVRRVTGNDSVHAFLQPLSGAALVVLSVVLTRLGGSIPARRAARQDPVAALRTE